MTQSWLTLAGQDDATDKLLASWAIAEPIKVDGLFCRFPCLRLAVLCDRRSSMHCGGLRSSQAPNFRAQNGRSHLTFNRIANFNAKIELGVLTMMERPAAEVALRPADRRYAGRRATAAHLLMVGGSNAASPMSFVAMLGVTATSVRPSDIGHFVAI
jgi:hypothetical protein